MHISENLCKPQRFFPERPERGHSCPQQLERTDTREYFESLDVGGRCCGQECPHSASVAATLTYGHRALPLAEDSRNDARRRSFDEGRLSQINRFEPFARDKIVAPRRNLAKHRGAREHNPSSWKPRCHFRADQ